MKIKQIRIEEKSFLLKVPFVTALRRVEKLEALHLVIETDDGLRGTGAAAEVKAITGEDKASLLQGFRKLQDFYTGHSLNRIENELQYISSWTDIGPGPKGAMDIALHDLYSQKEGLPLYSFLGGKPGSIISDLTISLNDKKVMVRDALQAEADGFEILKIKLGADWEDDIQRFREVSQSVGCRLRIDANQGWSVKESLAFTDICNKENLPIDLLEQPVKADDIEGMAFIKERINCPLAADETVFTAEDALRVIDKNAADIINVKLLKCGGIHQAQKILKAAESAGLLCMMGCMMESPVGIAAALHLTAASPVIQYFDLDVPYLLKDIPENYGFKSRGIGLYTKDRPGLICD